MVRSGRFAFFFGLFCPNLIASSDPFPRLPVEDAEHSKRTKKKDPKVLFQRASYGLAFMNA